MTQTFLSISSNKKINYIFPQTGSSIKWNEINTDITNNNLQSYLSFSPFGILLSKLRTGVSADVDDIFPELPSHFLND